MQDKPLYYITLKNLKAEGLRRGLPPVALKYDDVAALVGVSRRTVERKKEYYRFKGTITTYEKLAAVLSEEGA